MPDRVGQQLGNYRLIKLLGRGGFADVYLGKHLHLGTQAAIKVLHTQLTPVDVELFRNEARVIAHLEHPHIVRVLDFGVENDIPFLVMNFAPFGTLRQHHPKGTRVPFDIIVSYVNQIAPALQYAHFRKRIHRDIKPENMLLGRNHEILLSDFGISVMAHSQLSLTPQVVLGTPHYMAPEQSAGAAQPESDQYSLGIVIYEWLTGTCPFNGISLVEIALKHLADPPPPIRDLVPSISLEVEQVVLKALAKKPEQRFASVSAFAQALEQASHAEQVIVPPLPPPAGKKLPPESTLSTYRGHSGTRNVVKWLAHDPYIVSEYGYGSEWLEVWNITTHTRLSSYREHSSHSFACSPDGQFIASAYSGGIDIWDVLTGKIVNVCHGAEQEIIVPAARRGDFLSESVYMWITAWSSDGKWIASAADNCKIYVWNTTTGGEVALSYTEHSKGICALTWSHDSKFIASADVGGSIQVWEAQTGRVISSSHYDTNSDPEYTRRTETSTSSAQMLTWSPNGNAIASTYDHKKVVQVWDITTGHEVSSYPNHTAFVHTLAWLPDGKLIASVDDPALDYVGTVHVWNSLTGNRITSYGGLSSRCAWSPDNTHIVSAPWGYESHKAGETTIKVWEVMTGRNPAIYRDPALEVEALAWSPDGAQIASCSSKETICIWDVATGNDVMRYDGHAKEGRVVAWSPTGQYVASEGEEAIGVHVWDATTGRLVTSYRGHSGQVLALVWSSTGTHIATGSYDGTIQVWEASTGKHIVTYSGHAISGYTFDMRWLSNDTQIASMGSVNGKDETHLWDATTGHLIATYPHTPAFLSPDGARSAVISATWSIEIHNLSTHAVLATYIGHRNSSISKAEMLAWSPDGTRIASCSTLDTHVWDALTGAPLITAQGPSLQNRSQVVWSPDSTHVAVFGYPGLYVYNAVTAELIAILTTSSTIIHWSPDSTRLAFRSAGNIRVWDVVVKNYVAAHPSEGFKFSWSPDSTRIVSCSKDIIVHVWQAS